MTFDLSRLENLELDHTTILGGLRSQRRVDQLISELLGDKDGAIGAMAQTSPLFSHPELVTVAEHVAASPFLQPFTIEVLSVIEGSSDLLGRELSDRFAESPLTSRLMSDGNIVRSLLASRLPARIVRAIEVFFESESNLAADPVAFRLANSPLAEGLVATVDLERIGRSGLSRSALAKAIEGSAVAERLEIGNAALTVLTASVLAYNMVLRLCQIVVGAQIAFVATSSSNPRQGPLSYPTSPELLVAVGERGELEIDFGPAGTAAELDIVDETGVVHYIGPADSAAISAATSGFSPGRVITLTVTHTSGISVTSSAVVASPLDHLSGTATVAGASRASHVAETRAAGMTHGAMSLQGTGLVREFAELIGEDDALDLWRESEPLRGAVTYLLQSDEHSMPVEVRERAQDHLKALEAELSRMGGALGGAVRSYWLSLSDFVSAYMIRPALEQAAEPNAAKPIVAVLDALDNARANTNDADIIGSALHAVAELADEARDADPTQIKRSILAAIGIRLDAASDDLQVLSDGLNEHRALLWVTGVISAAVGATLAAAGATLVAPVAAAVTAVAGTILVMANHTYQITKADRDIADLD